MGEGIIVLMFRTPTVVLSIAGLAMSLGAGVVMLSNRALAQAPAPPAAAPILDNARLTVRRAIQPAGTIEKPHTHPEADYLSIQLGAGSLEVTVGGETTKGSPGMAWYLPKGTTHTMNNVGTTPVEVIVVSFK
jgi:quercetin dioxygenase-like cupin family protein